MQVGLVWTFDHILELLAFIVGVIAAGGAIVAAVFSIRGNANTVAAAQAETDRWRADIRPAPIASFGVATHQSLEARIVNAGGAIQPGYLAVVNDESLYAGTYFVGAHTSSIEWFYLRLVTKLAGPYQTGFGVHKIVVHLARDVDGAWRDSMLGVTLTEPVPEPSSDEFTTWCETKWRAALEM